MKYLVLTDIHGSSFYLELALQKIKSQKCEKILLLGDILYHGPRNDLPEGYNPKQVVMMLNRLSDKIIAIKGNCDAEVDEMVLDFKLESWIDLSLSDTKITLTHGHHLHEIKRDNYILYGHYHVNNVNGNLINIGSLSIPKDSHHTYAIIDNQTLRSYDLFSDEILLEVNL